MQPTTASADSEIVAALAVVERLHATCCEPGRSPRMERLTETLTALQHSLAEGGPVDDTMSTLADAGAQVGWLQVACCAEKRMPLYEEVQQHLGRVYREMQQHGH
ncbi:MAG TPA: hypothetical protein VFY15_06590 [Acidimicrobiia bacterium]|nr:hypothetical protein [Acidimicrobiia bacterium]